MGREVRRVPLDFDWPLDELWEGYLLPDRLREDDCPDCDGRGTTAAHQWVEQIAALCLLLNQDLNSQQQGRPMHPYFNDTGSRAGRRPSPDIAEFAIGLAGRGEPGRFHDSIDNWNATDKLIEAAGLDPEVWGKCQSCGGHGTTERYPGQREDAEAWEPHDPPEGEGWQLWSTTTEGHPMTPVFATDEELADYCARENVPWFGHSGAPREQWLASFRGERIPGMVQIAPGVVMM